MDPGSFFKKLLIFAALEANQITLPYNSADNFVTESFKLEIVVIVKEIANLETGMYLM